ncbi:MAG: ArsR family transcriptional regulator [Chloroflexota bacterium]|nr:MAG: ArsR family transcriptional regulator [Chloroflexota bacterium]
MDDGCAGTQLGVTVASATNLELALKALADPVRLAIFRMLRQREQCVCHLTEATGLSQGTVSHHMGVLKRAGLVRDRRDLHDARWVYYSLDPMGVKALREAIDPLLEPSAVDSMPADCCGRD